MDSDTGLEESTWQLRLDSYPERPGEPDCNYYMRTGTCGYGERCRFNHPRDRSVVGGGRSGGGEYPERAGQPACLYFLKTGNCKYGASCKYDHPRQGGGSARPVSLNCYGFPLRPGEKECSYYLRTGQCKFGSTCKFNHPEPAGVPVPSPAAAFYPAVQAPTIANWQVTRSTVLPAPYMQPTFGSMVISPGVVPVSGWSPYPTISPTLSPGGLHGAQAGSLFGSSNQLSPSAPAFQGPYAAAITSSAGPSSRSQKEQVFPERPGLPECQYYMRTGDCKFGPTCKYHHPPEWRMPRTDCVLSPVGLPLRPVLSKKRCRLEQQRLSSLVYVMYNIKLREWNMRRRNRKLDPILIDEISLDDEWIVELEDPCLPTELGWLDGENANNEYLDVAAISDHISLASDDTNGDGGASQSAKRQRGAQPCSFYTQHGVCKFGPTCKFDHPMGVLSYSPSASSLSDMPVAPYPPGFSVATLAPSSSSSDFTSNKDSFSIQITSTENMPSGSIGSMFSGSG